MSAPVVQMPQKRDDLISTEEWSNSLKCKVVLNETEQSLLAERRSIEQRERDLRKERKSLNARYRKFRAFRLRWEVERKDLDVRLANGAAIEDSGRVAS